MGVSLEGGVPAARSRGSDYAGKRPQSLHVGGRTEDVCGVCVSRDAGGLGSRMEMGIRERGRGQRKESTDRFLARPRTLSGSICYEESF